MLLCARWQRPRTASELLGRTALLTGLLCSGPGAVAEMTAGVTGTHQAARGTSAETLASFDLSVQRGLGPGEVLLYVEGSSSPERDGVVAHHASANADAGTALDGSGSGRVQVSELLYRVPLADGEAAAGLLDATRFLDATGGDEADFTDPGFANDENTHFLNAAFVNNPAIAFPDYAPGVTWRSGPRSPQLRLLATSGTGLGETRHARHGEVVDVGADGRGVFAAVEGYRLAAHQRTLRVGLWRNSRAPEADNGLYAVAGGQTEEYRWNVRLGLSRGRLAARRFAGLAVGRQAPAGVLGGAVGWLSDRDSGSGWQTELYWRVPLGDHWQLTPDLQWLREPGGRTAVVAGLRVTAAWSRP